MKDTIFKQKTRSLTLGERAMAESVFGDSLRLDSIRLQTAWWVFKNYAVSPNGNVYFHPDNWIEDFSYETLSKQAWLIHELTHVWQVQQGVNVVRKAMFDRRYRYIITAGKSFLQYGIEQQASMVEDYFIKRSRGEDCAELLACIPFLHTSIDVTDTYE